MQVNIIWNGEKVKFKDLETNGILLKSLLFTDRRNNSADDVSLELADFQGKFKATLIPQKADKVQFEIFQDDKKLVTPTFYVDGVSWNIGFDSVSIKGLNINYLKNSSFWKRKSFSYKNTSLRKIVDGVCQRNKFKLLWFGNDFELKYIAQKNISDYRFLKLIADARKDFFKIGKKQVVWGSTTENITYSKTGEKITVDTGSGSRFINLNSWDFTDLTLTAETNKKTKFQLESLDVFNKRLNKILGVYSDDFDYGTKDAKDLIIASEEAIKGTLGDTVLSSLKGTGTIPIGEWNKIKPQELLSGSVIYLGNQGKLSGTYILESVTHRITPSGWVAGVDINRIVSKDLKIPKTKQKLAKKQEEKVTVKGSHGYGHTLDYGYTPTKP